MKGMSKSVNDVFVALAKYAQKSGTPTIKDKLWQVKLDDQWEFAVNGYAEKKETAPFLGSGFKKQLQPFECYIEFNGWPAAIITPGGGEFAAGEAANPETFISALERAA